MRVRSSSKLAMLLVAGFPFVSDGCPPIEILLRLMTQAAYGSTAEIYIPADCPAHLVCASPTCFIASENGSFERGRKQREEPGLDPIRPNRWRPGGPARLTAESFKSCQGFYSLFLHDRDTLRQQAFQVIDYDDLFPPGLAARPTRLRVGASFAATSGETAPRTFKTTVFTFSGLDPDSFPAGTDPYTYAAQALSVETASVTADQSPSVSWVPVEGAHALPPETDLIVLLLEYELSGDLSRYTVYVDGVQAVLDAGPYGPTAAPDFAVTDAGEPVDVDVLANDRDPDGVIDPATLRVVVDPTNGTAILDDGSIRYTPDAGFAGDDAFSYVFTDADGLNAGALATVTVRPGNRPPVALPDTVTVPAGTVLDLDVLANDTDPDGDAIRVFAAGDPPNGTAEIIDGGRAIRYTPDPGFTGDDVFAYLIVDARGARSNEVEVTITVQ